MPQRGSICGSKLRFRAKRANKHAALRVDLRVNLAVLSNRKYISPFVLINFKFYCIIIG